MFSYVCCSVAMVRGKSTRKMKHQVMSPSLLSHTQYLLRRDEEKKTVGWDLEGGRGRRLPFQLEKFTLKSFFAHITCTRQHSRSKPHR